MNEADILELLKGIKAGTVAPEEVLLTLRKAPFEDIGFAKVDHHRGVRQGNQEVIFGQNKTPEQILGIVRNMSKQQCKDILITRMSREAAQILEKEVPLSYYELPKVGIVDRTPHKELKGSIVIASGGTSDMAVCEEAALTAEVLGNKVHRMYDVGVAGLHRLLAQMDVLLEARVIIAVAGMEGALASVIGGLTDCPVIAVPTSVGYGANFGGVSALLSMLNSCASGVTVVNIDNGFGAAYSASMINHMGVQ